MGTEMVNIKINGMPLSVPKGISILEAAKLGGIDIPTLCYLKDINEIGACRICVVEVKGAKTLVASCVYPVSEGMEVVTNSDKVIESRKMTLELILSNHEKTCLYCVRSGNCELQKLSLEYGLDDPLAWSGEQSRFEIDDSAVHMWRNNNKCILCRRCSAVCAKNQAVGVIGANDRGFKTHIGSAFELDLAEVPCVSCGQCITVCPVGAIGEKDDGPKVESAIRNPEKTVVVQAAPSIRATLGEEFGLPVGTNVQGKMVAALRRLGFDKVFDTDFGADLTIMEEANELVERVKNGGKLPMITSCSPGWINFCEMYYPEMLDNLSTCKSPQQMFGAIVKTWYAGEIGKDPKDIVSVSVMPCTAKKFEIGRDDQDAAGVPDVDISITTRELARMIRRAGIDFAALPEEEFDSPLGLGSGAGHIFGATGGVMEAALRTAAEWITGTPGGPLEFGEVRGTAGIKEASYKLGDLTVSVCVASGLTNAREALESVKRGEKNYTFIEFMACPGGCVNGGGQPIQPSSVRNFTDLKALRAKALYDEDGAMELRRSHENPAIKELYEKFLEKPGSHVAHKVLHTSYNRERKKFVIRSAK